MKTQGLDKDDLLPGVPDQITLEWIVPKLHWRDVRMLREVSPIWQQAIESGEVQQARVRSRSTDSLVIVNYSRCSGLNLFQHDLGLYCMRDKTWFALPQLPCPGVRSGSQCISLDGKFYVIGGKISQDNIGSKDMFMMDLLAGQLKWTRCASMAAPRLRFGATIFDGKIYVVGGCPPGSGPSHGCEVYDPKVNTWSPIWSFFATRVGHEIATVGEEIFVYGGSYTDMGPVGPDAMARGIQRADIVPHRNFDPNQALSLSRSTMLLDAYNPMNEETRRRIRNSVRPQSESVFMFEENFCRVTPMGVDMYDLDKDLWSPLYSFSRFPIGVSEAVFPRLSHTLAIGGEVLVVRWLEHANKRCCILRSRGFGGHDKKISWEIVERSPHIQNLSKYPFLYPIQL